jgi:hypothetical protein
VEQVYSGQDGFNGRLTFHAVRFLSLQKFSSLG